mgnify:CR=1 FL=1
MKLPSITQERKILFLSNIIAPYNVAFFNGLAAAWGSHLLFMFDAESEANRSWTISNDNIYFDYEIKNSFYINKPARGINQSEVFRNIYIPLYVLKEILKIRPKLVISIEFGLRSLFALVVCKITRSKLVIMSDVIVETEKTTGWLKRLIRRLIIMASDGFVARSNHAAEYLKSLGAANDKIVVAPYAVDLGNNTGITLQNNLFKGKSADSFTLLYCGHISHRKGVDLLVDAVQRLPMQYQRDLLVLLAGGTSDDLEKLAPGYDRDIFQVIGYLQASDLFLLYQRADCMILPTRHDTWALVVNEAMEAGCPVLVSKYAGAANELVIDGSTGKVFNPLNHQEFVESLIFVMSNKSTLQQYALAAKEYVSNFSYHVAVERTNNLLSRLIYEK